MEEFTLVLFTMEDSYGRQKRKSCWQYHAEKLYEECTKEPEDMLVRTILLHLPRLMQPKKEWTAAGLADYVRGLPVPGESPYVYYYYLPEAAVFLHRKKDCLSAEWARFLLRYYRIRTEALFVLEDTCVQGEDWLYRYARDTRYMGVVTEHPERQEETADFLQEEYGITLQVTDSAGKCRIPKGATCLYIAQEKLYGLRPADIREGDCVLLMGEGESNDRRFASRIPEERTVSVERYIRSRHKNGIPDGKILTADG